MSQEDPSPQSGTSQNIVEITHDGAIGYRAWRFPSGLRLIYRPDDEPVAYMGYIVAVGSGNDPMHYHGMAHFIEHMLFKGTKLRSARAIINRMEEVGADFNAYTTKEETFIYTAALAEHAPRVIQLMTDVVKHSTFPLEEMAKEKNVILEELNSYKDTPSEMIFDEFENLLFHATPLGHNILGTERSLERITREAALNFMSQYYRTERMVFCIRGKVQLDALFDYLLKEFPPSVQNRTLQKQQEIRVKPMLRERVTHRFNTHQVHRVMGCEAYSLYDKRSYALALLNNILGGRGMNARLNLILREDLGVVYSVESNYSPYATTGCFSIYFGAAKEHLEEATERVWKELRRFINEPIEESDLRAACRQIMGQMAVAEDNRENAFLAMGKSFMLYNRYESREEVAAHYAAVSADDIVQVAKELFGANKMLTLTYR
jgi:hypothetical protein